MGSQSRGSKKSNRKRDDPIHVAREREATLREEGKKRNNRERQARYRAKKKDDLEASSLASPIDSTPPPSDSVPPASPLVCHSPVVLHDPIPSLSLLHTYYHLHLLLLHFIFLLLLCHHYLHPMMLVALQRL